MAASIDTSPCTVPRWLPGGHSQTLYGALFTPYKRVAFSRERIDTPDGDFIDFDWARPEPTDQFAPSRTRAMLLLHGLEGSSQSRYAQSITQYFSARGWAVVVAHFRGCSGTPNRLARAYHSGDTQEVDFIVSTLKAKLPEADWHAVGISLGGNALLKYLGECTQQAGWFKAACAISVPVDLVASGNYLSDQFFNREVYTRFFLHALKPKVLAKAKRFPGTIDAERVAKAKTLRDFDDAYTAPMHGFINALDYWTKASSKPWLTSIDVPTLLINARNDPFWPESCLPSSGEASDKMTLHYPAEGGHAGFVTGGFPGDLGWLPARINRFFETTINEHISKRM